MDRMQIYELTDIFENLPFMDVNSWEQTRLQVYTTSQIMSTKKLKLTDILKFPWEKEKEDEERGKEKEEYKLPQEISNEDIKRLKEKANMRKQTC